VAGVIHRSDFFQRGCRKGESPFDVGDGIHSAQHGQVDSDAHARTGAVGQFRGRLCGGAIARAADSQTKHIGPPAEGFFLGDDAS